MGASVVAAHAASPVHWVGGTLATQPLNAVAGALTVGLALTIYGALRKVLDGMEANYRAEVMNRVRQRSAELLNILYCHLADEATLEREFKDYTGPNERRALQAFQEMLQQTPAQIADPPPPPPSAFRVSALDFTDTPPAFPYKEGEFTLPEEAQRFLEGGGYRQWRHLRRRDLGSDCAATRRTATTTCGANGSTPGCDAT